ncbi:unnamed protein product [Closterium sp. NIES-54]
MSPYTPRDRAEELTSRSPDSPSAASLDRHSGGGSVHAEDSADRLIFISQCYAERSSCSNESGDGGSHRGSGSGHGSPRSSIFLTQQHRDLHRQQQGGFPPSLAAERRDPRSNRAGGGDGAVYAAEIEYGYERYSHPGAKSGAIAAGGGNYSQVATRGGSARASTLGRQSWSHDNPAAFRASEYTVASGYRAAPAAAGSRARYSKASAETGLASDLQFGAGGGMQSAGTRGTEFNGIIRDEYRTAERGHATNDTESWWRDGDRYGREAACAAAGREAVMGQGGGYLTAQIPENSGEAARVMALLNAAAEYEEDHVGHAGGYNSGSAGTSLAKTPHQASAKSVLAIMAVVTVVLVLLPACLSDVGPPPAELMLVPVVVMLLLLTLVLTPTISSHPARSHPS